MTWPGATSRLRSSLPRFTLNPRPFRVVVAASGVEPITLGTATGLWPLLTMTVTTWPRFSGVPTGGAEAVTRPAPTLSAYLVARVPLGGCCSRRGAAPPLFGPAPRGGPAGDRPRAPAAPQWV